MATTEQDIRKLLKENPPIKQFVPYCYLSKEADALTVYFEGDADYSERLSDHITLYRSIENNEVVGCRVKGISGLIADLPNYIRYKDGDIELSVIFLAYRGDADSEVADTLKDLAKAATERNMALQTSA